MAIDFPSTGLTANVTTYSAGSRTWQWTGVYWKATSTTVGYTGSIGSVGYTGSWGYFGSTGYTGSVGYTGSASTAVGYTGSWGYFGSVGYTGSLGYTGSASTVIGYSGSQGESSYSYSTSAPSSPKVGDRWYDSNNGVEVVWTDDGTSTQWVEIAASGYLGQTGYAGSRGVTGFVGSQGLNTMLVALSDELNALTTGTPKLTIRAPSTMYLGTAPRAMVTSASTSGNVTVDMLVAGTTILGTKLILNSGVYSTYSSPATLVTTPTTISEDAVITFNVTYAGTNAAGLKVTVYFNG